MKIKLNAKNYFNNVLTGWKAIFQNKASFLLFFTILLVFLGAFVFLPILFIPGNSLELQLNIYTLKDYLILFYFSFISSIIILASIYSFSQKKTSLFKGAVGGYSSIFGGLTATAACSSCIAPLLAFFGLGSSSVFFVLSYRPFIIAPLIIILFVLAVFSLSSLSTCSTCSIESESRGKK